jgi:DNA-binding CsgD family transcriptional regulator
VGQRASFTKKTREVATSVQRDGARFNSHFVGRLENVVRGTRPRAAHEATGWLTLLRAALGSLPFRSASGRLRPYHTTAPNRREGRSAMAARASRSDSVRASRDVGLTKATPAAPVPPIGFEVHTLAIGSDEYAILTFEIAQDDPSRYELSPADGLTPTERSIVSLVLRGQRNAAIARARGTSPRTIANQLATIYRKLGVTSRRELRVRVGGDEGAPL